MNKIKIFIISIFLFIFFSPINVKAVTDTYGNGEYAIIKYKIEIIVDEDNTLDITENITAYFNVNKHGIYRKIPLKNEIFRLDGTKSYNRAKVNNVEVSEYYTSYSESGYKVIKIGDPNSTLTGEKDYIIKYSYNIGKDTGKDYDEFYFNLIGNEWDTTISNLEFSITMPKEFDASKLGFSSGETGSTDNSKIIYNVNGNVISGYYNDVLKASEALTIRLELPEGYFINTNNSLNFMTIVMICLPALFAIISFLLWIKYGKDDEVIETVEFYPPEGFNSAELGFMYKGSSDSNDVTSLLIYLANKGYIRIEETEDSAVLFKNKGFKIIKIKEYDGDNINEKMFFRGLFTHKESMEWSTINLKNHSKDNQKIILSEEFSETKLNEVTAMDLYDNFYIILDTIMENIGSKENKNKILEKSTTFKSISVFVMIMLSLLLIIVVPTYEYAGMSELESTLFTTLFYIPFFSVLFIKKAPMYFKLFWGGFTSIHFLMVFSSLPITEALAFDSIYMIGLIIGLVSIIIMIICYKLMPKRTPYGNEILGKIKGFKNFLETAEKPALEELVMKNPAYFYNILPYTYVLGVSNKWIKKFEDISLKSPEWYSGTTDFNAMSFGSFISSTMSTASSAMSSSSSSGGGSGGGSSGGGSGGGGGGSW